MEYLVKHKGKDVVVKTIKADIERGDYFLAIDTKGKMTIVICDSVYMSDHGNNNLEYNHRIIKASSNIHHGHSLYNLSVKIDPTIGKALLRNCKIESILD